MPRSRPRRVQRRTREPMRRGAAARARHHIPWEAFADPPLRSNLKADTDRIKAMADGGPPVTDDAVLRMAMVRALERQGMPAAPRPQWLEKLIYDRLTLVQAGIRQMRSVLPSADSPDILAAAVGLGVFWRMCEPYRGVSLNELLVNVAEQLGPGVGVHEVKRLVRWAFPHLKDDVFLSAIETVELYTECPHYNLSLD